MSTKRIWKLIFLSLVVIATVAASSHVDRVAAQSVTKASTAQVLNHSQQALVEGSKKAILETGISESYFNAHFQLAKVLDQVSDRRVTWRLAINDYETFVTDSIGYYTEGNRRVDIHSISKMLGRTTEIKATISRSRALRMLRACLGTFEKPSVHYGPVDGQARLLLVANKQLSKAEERELKEKLEREQPEELKSEEEIEKPRYLIGSVNLQTGKCSKSYAVIAP